MVKKIVKTSTGSKAPLLQGRMTSYMFSHGAKISLPGTYSSIETSASATIDLTGLTEESEVQALLKNLRDAVHLDVETQIKEKLNQWKKILAAQKGPSR